ncbi:serine-rich adhesin for platelets-like [Oppia nitens]|uniref:serine-rich adhesin for platelets-like n=1 Tax=Oppia nitens TaxID=1686743 RepID=UPI0023DB1695|nr:serine-rich adhesin for platelets-like [Oppia nitens]
MTLTINQIMISMGNVCTSCPTFCLHRTSNMKSAMSSSSVGSERNSGSGGVITSIDFELESNKSQTKSNGRMSCTSDDSCAINELLEGRMDLNVKLPNKANNVVINVERRTPMLDLLVNISTQYRFNAANYTICVGDREFKASTPIGSLDVNQIAITPKPIKNNSLKSNSPSTGIPFQTTFRLQVNLPRNQLMVLRVTPNATIAAIKQIICSEKSLDANKYQLVRIVTNNQTPQVLDANKTLAYYTLNEVTLISNKALSQIEVQFVAHSTSQIDLSNNSSVASLKKPINSLIISQSNPDFTTMDEKSIVNHTPTGSKPQKKRQAPLPPMSSSATLPNRLSPSAMNSFKDKNETNIQKTDLNEQKDDHLSQTIIESKPVLKVLSNGVSHVRQNSGSDSSGYHESVLSSSDSPEQSTNLPKDSLKASAVTQKSTSSTNCKITAKKRRAPPPPSITSEQSVQQLADINGKNNDFNSDESKSVLECMSEVSLPLSTSSSSSSGNASSINNRSLSPIVITQTNGSSTPLQDFKNCSYDQSNEDKSIQSISDNTVSFNSDECIPQDKEINTIESIVDKNQCNNNDIKNDDKEDRNVSKLKDSSQQLSNLTQTYVRDVEKVSLKLSSIDRTIDSKDIDENVGHINNNLKINETINKMVADNSQLLINETSFKSLDKQSVAEINYISPALDLDDNECTSQVVEEHEDREGNREIDLAELSIPLPPPSPFQNSIYDENSSLSESIDESANEKSILSQPLIDCKSDYLQTNEESLETIEKKKSQDFEELIKYNQTTNNESNISDEELINKEIEVTLQSLNEELDRLESSDNIESQQSIQLNITQEVDNNDEISNIKSIRSERPSPTPSPTPRLSITAHNYKNKTEKDIKSDNFKKISESDSKTSVEVIKSQIPTPPLSPLSSSLSSSYSTSPSPTSEEKMSITDEVKQLCKPRVRLANFSIGSYKREVDIYEDKLNTKRTEQSMSSSVANPKAESFATFPSLKKEEKIRPSITQNKSKVNITSTSTTITSSTTTKPIRSPQIQTLITSAPKINRIHSWSGNKNTVLEDNDVKQPVKSQERYVSQISIKSDEINMNATTIKSSENGLQSPKFKVQSLIAQNEERLKSRSPSPQLPPQRAESIKERTTITIKPGSESVIRFNSKNFTDIYNNNSTNTTTSTTTTTTTTTTNNNNNVITKQFTSQKKFNNNLTDNKQNSIQIKENNDLKKKLNYEINDSKSGLKEVKFAINETKPKINDKEEPSQAVIVPPPIPPPIQSPAMASVAPIPPPIPPPIPSPVIASMPPIPPPIPPPVPQTIKTFGANTLPKTNTKAYQTKGWNSDKVVRNGGEVPKVKHVEPPNNMNVRDQLLNEIKSFGGRNTLKKVSKNTSWKLEVNAVKT